MRHTNGFGSRRSRFGRLLEIEEADAIPSLPIVADADQDGVAKPSERATAFDPVRRVEQFDFVIGTAAFQACDQAANRIALDDVLDGGLLAFAQAPELIGSWDCGPNVL